MRRIVSAMLAVAMLLTLVPASFAESDSDAVWQMSYYIDSENGNDDNDGLTPETAFATLNRAFQMKFHPGFNILFRRGGSYAGGQYSNGCAISSSGTAEYPITLGSYGEGANPVIYTYGDEYAMEVTGSNVHISGLDFTAPNGGGLKILSKDEGDTFGITVESCRFYNIRPERPKEADPRFALIIWSYTNPYRIYDCCFRDLEIFNCCNGISEYGTSVEYDYGYFMSEEESYNYDLIFEDLYLHDIWCQGFELGGVRDSVVRNSRFINVSRDVPVYCAPMWTHACKNCVIEYCEIAGATNRLDGMAIDFDGWTQDCTYRYIYSHDNNRFMHNCLYDNKTKNSGNTVDHCLSVNDRMALNNASFICITQSNLQFGIKSIGLYTKGFTFTNNIVLNSSPFFFGTVRNANISGNYFGGANLFTLVLSTLFSVSTLLTGSTVKNNTYYCFAPFAGCGTKLTLKPMTADQAMQMLFPNGVHT